MLDPWLAAGALELRDVAAAGHFAAGLLRPPGATGGGVFVDERAGEARRRFALAHVLGHYHIGEHHVAQGSFLCTADDLLTGVVRVRDPRAIGAPRTRSQAAMEWEANEFAAEFLMPAAFVAGEVAGRGVTVATAARVADACGVPFPIAALRLVQVAGEPCAVVVTRVRPGAGPGGMPGRRRSARDPGDARIAWHARSAACPPLARDPGEPPHPRARVAGVARGEPGAYRRPSPVPPAAWFRGAWPGPGRLVESVRPVGPTYDVVSLLAADPPGPRA